MEQKYLELNPPKPVGFSMGDVSDFEDATGISWDDANRMFQVRKTLDAAKAGEPTPKSVDELEADLRHVSKGLNVAKITMAVLWLKYRTSNPNLTFDDIRRVEPDEFTKLAAALNAAETGSGKDSPLDTGNSVDGITSSK